MRSINPMSFAIAALNKAEKESLAYIHSNNSAFARELQNDCKLVRRYAREGYFPEDHTLNDHHNTVVHFTNETVNVSEEFSNQESQSAVSAFCEAYELAAKLADLC